MLAAALGVGLVGLGLLLAVLTHRHGTREMLFVMATWAVAASASRLLVVLGSITGPDALTFSGTLSFGVLPTLLWVIWRRG